MKWLGCLVGVWSAVAFAAPRDFAFTWTTQTAPARHSQFEGWLTSRIARTDDFVRFDGRLAWTVALVDGLETQFSVDPIVESTSLSSSLDGTVSNVWRWTTWKAGSPFAVGGLGRLSLGIDRVEFEARLLADLKVDRLLFALNVSAERAQFWNGRTGVDTRLEESLGARFALSATASFGLEARAKTSWDHRLYRGTALYLGPTLAFTNEYFWVSMGAYAQVWAQRGDGERGAAEPQELSDNERFLLRLVVGAPSSK